MADHVLCPKCRHANPPENRFCGSCGVSLDASGDLVVHRENNPTVMGRTLPAELGSAGKVVAVGLAMLAVEVGLSWLRHKARVEDRPLTLTPRRSDTAVSERLLGESVEEILIQELEGDYRRRVFVRRAVRSFVIAKPTDRRS